ncbi:MAG: glycosyltransferase family 9 protein [Alphaproteobacteria bacterium]
MSFSQRSILIIKFGALGDFALALGAMQAIRHHHQQDRLILLTTKPFEELARQSQWFDEIWTMNRPRQWNLWAWWRLARRIHAWGIDRIYDLQRSKGTERLFFFLPYPKPEWNGIARGCSHPHRDPQQHDIHTRERHQSQLAETGIKPISEVDLSWVKADIARFRIPHPYAALVPGASRQRSSKRWPVLHYADLAEFIGRHKITPVILGSGDEAAIAQIICQKVPQAISLVNQTSFPDIVALARQAQFAVGNDTGPMHLIAPTGCPSLTLFGPDSRPGLTEPRGAKAQILAAADLNKLDVAMVVAKLREMTSF